MQTIRQLSQQTAEQLCAQQVITSLPDCVKQLVDNSIDAGATFIKVSLQQYGKNGLQVLDNGIGISSFQFLGKKGATSKNKSNQKYDHLGFRGQALHSLGRVCGKMVIRSKSMEDQKLRVYDVVLNNLVQSEQDRSFNHAFSFQMPNRRKVKTSGTLVQISQLFLKLPPRQNDLNNNFKQFIKKTHELIKQYCLIYPEIQFILANIKKGKQQLLIHTTVKQIKFQKITWLERIKQLDQKLANILIFVHGQYYEGFVLNRIQSGSSRQNSFIKKNYCYMYANRRPINPIPAIFNFLGETYKKHNHHTKLAFILNLKLQHNVLDINLTPDKRQILIKKDIIQKILQSLKKQINQKVVEDIPNLSQFKQKQQQRKSQNLPNNQQSKNIQEGLKESIIIQQKQKFNSSSLQQKQVKKKQKVLIKTQFQTQYKKPQQDIQKKKSQSKLNNDLPALPKVNIDRQKLKLSLNSKLIFNPNFKRSTENNNQPNNQIQNQKPANQMNFQKPEQNQMIFTKNIPTYTFRQQIGRQQLKQRQQSDAKKRVQFMKQFDDIKIQDDQFKKFQKSTIQFIQKKSILKTDKKQHQTKQKNNNFKTQNNKYQQNQQQQEQNNELQQSCVSHSSGNHDKNLEQRIKQSLNTDMSQIFNKFKSKTESKNQSQIMIVQTIQQEIPNNKPIVLQQQTNILERLNKQKKQRQIINKKINQQKQQQTKKLWQQLGSMAPRQISKQQFADFKVLGQFNKAFIVSFYSDRFYLVDQHAADQKRLYQKWIKIGRNIESLGSIIQENITTVECDEIQEAQNILNKSGFYFDIINRQKVKVNRCPCFDNKKLGMEYFWQIVNNKKQLSKLGKFTAMCALKACHGAIRVGDVLLKESMTKQLIALSTLQSPWNCPHGRPTLIQLGLIKNARIQIKYQKCYNL